MRPTVWLTLLVFVVIGAGIRGHSSSIRAASKAASAQARQPVASWIVEGGWEVNQEEAIASAFQKAEAKVGGYLRDRDPRLVWLPNANYIRDHLWRDLGLSEVANPAAGERRPVQSGMHSLVVDEKTFENLGTMHKAYVKVTLTPDDCSAIRHKDSLERQKQRRELSKQRQVLLAKVLVGVVVLLVVVVGYFRLEEATKGYYTAWLRVAALAVLAAVVAGLLLVA